ncbi:MAG: hypothetical protein ABJQ98_01440 [Alloalcanivorax venustensis]|uniref:hypothetical protein n=1 Tax=Alloalcanivorax venustensis TaxID=172371 RepID=UPI0032969E5A
MTRALVIVAVAGLLLTGLGALLDGAAFLRAWLVAALTGIALPLGAMAILMTHNLTGGQWGEPVRAPLKAVVATLPLMLVLFLPLLMGVRVLFAWTGDLSGLPEVVRHKGFYLNPPFFYARFALYAVIWLTLAARLSVWRGDRRSTPASAGGLVLWALTTTFFAFDWIMSLEPAWYSDILGLIFMGSALSMALALPFLLPGVYPDADRRPALAGARRDLAHLWLAAILFWVFVAFSQYLIIWSGDLPHEIRWYAHRGQGGWQWLALAMMTLCGALPFAALLPAGWKRRARPLAVLAALVLLGHALEFAWLVLPAYYPHHWPPGWRSPVALLTVAALGLLLIHRHRLRHAEDTP